MPKAKTLQGEKIRKQKISVTLTRKHANKELIQWNKGIRMSEKYCKKLKDYWKTHEPPGKKNKGRTPWNKGLKGYMAGKKNGNWKGGIDTKAVMKIRNSIEYREWQKQVLKRDKYNCQVCYSKCQLEAHHIKPFVSYPKLRFDINNGVTLCRKCHDVYRGNKKTYNKSR